MDNIMVEDEQKAKESRDRIETERINKPYYWWEMPDPFETEATLAPKTNSGGLARSRQELRKRQGKE